MLRIDGEITSFISDFDFSSKDELMSILRNLRKQPNLHPTCEYEHFYGMIGVAIQQAYYANPNQIMRFKNYCIEKAKTGGNDGRTKN